MSALVRHKNGFFILEGMNAFATAFYFFYLFFYTQKTFGFGNLENLALSALNGFVYMVFAWLGGRCGQRFGYGNALRVGFAIMLGSLIVGAFLPRAVGQVLVMIIWTIGMCFTWPNLEASVSEGEAPGGLTRMIGIYNLVWAGTSALAYFVGGAIMDRLGQASLFWIPAAIHAAQLIFLQYLLHHPDSAPAHAQELDRLSSLGGHDRPPPALARRFLHMAWIANPFAYVAINTVVAVIPTIAQELRLTQTLAGIFCSLWFFARFAAFGALWAWTGWHYRFRWFALAFVIMTLSAGIMLLIPKLTVVILAQIGFGAGIGLIYYSSLFYSMDVGDTKGEHGGLHEAAIGAGVFAGPAVGAATLHFMPHHPQSGAWAVCSLLVIGFTAVLTQWKRG